MTGTADEVFRLYKANAPYAGQACFADFLNQCLRDGIALSPPWIHASLLLDTLIAKAKVPTPTTLYRATVDHFVRPYVRGNALEYPAYMSTTTDESRIQRHFATGFRDAIAALLIIDCPAALPALDMETDASFGRHEFEVLLPRRACFEVLSETETDDSSEIAAITSGLYSASYRALKTYRLRYVR